MSFGYQLPSVHQITALYLYCIVFFLFYVIITVRAIIRQSKASKKFFLLIEAEKKRSFRKLGHFPLETTVKNEGKI